MTEEGLFQFPTGWNSTLVCRSCRRGYFVSIPNGMEFYRGNLVDVFATVEFQFPTGWNSTIIDPNSSADDVCFNSQRDGILLEPMSREVAEKIRFNSQRDGILLFRYFALGVPSSFNSQRDGILLNFISDFFWKLPVSIPNGMEFYPLAFASCSIASLFQFPTGWNST